MPENKDQADKIQGESGPETSGIIHISSEHDEHNADPEAVFDQEIIKFHTLDSLRFT